MGIDRLCSNRRRKVISASKCMKLGHNVEIVLFLPLTNSWCNWPSGRGPFWAKCTKSVELYIVFWHVAKLLQYFRCAYQTDHIKVSCDGRVSSLTDDTVEHDVSKTEIGETNLTPI